MEDFRVLTLHMYDMEHNTLANTVRQGDTEINWKTLYVQQRQVSTFAC